jgi:hypothetical protein
MKFNHKNRQSRVKVKQRPTLKFNHKSQIEVCRAIVFNNKYNKWMLMFSLKLLNSLKFLKLRKGACKVKGVRVTQSLKGPTKTNKMLKSNLNSPSNPSEACKA